MSTFLITWNPRRWRWTDLDQCIAQVQQTGQYPASWSCGVTKRIRPGDRLFLLRQGLADRGLVGSGWALSAPYVAEHWKDEQSKSRATARYVDLYFDFLAETPVIPRERLDQAPFEDMNWNPQASGVSVPEGIARALEEEWGRVTGSHFEPNPDEVDHVGLTEGHVTKISVNRYERNAYARHLCLAHHGTACVVCGFRGDAVYGDAAAGLIHVHHLTPLAGVGKTYRVDPVEDLRPVCPNCHAVIHRRVPPFTIEEVRAFMS